VYGSLRCGSIAVSTFGEFARLDAVIAGGAAVAESNGKVPKKFSFNAPNGKLPKPTNEPNCELAKS